MRTKLPSAMLAVVLTTFGQLGCTLLYDPFKGANPDHCSNSPERCTDSQICDPQSGQCVAADSDLGMPHRPVVNDVSPQFGLRSAPTRNPSTGSDVHADAIGAIGNALCESVAVDPSTQTRCSAPAQAVTCERQAAVAISPSEQTASASTKLVTYRRANLFEDRAYKPLSARDADVSQQQEQQKGRGSWDSWTV